jgi:[ribosomal protein S18]-alanine N-acetyltransferase
VKPVKSPAFSIISLDESYVEALAWIERASNTPPWSETSFKNEFDHDHSYVFGLLANGLLVGFLVLHIVEDAAHIMNLAVHTDYRRKGHGLALLNNSVVICKERAVSSIMLEVRESNVPAKGLYLKLGFLPIATRPRYYRDNDEDALVMKLVL